MPDEISKDDLCHCHDVAAYLDGELDNHACARFEQHAQECDFCAAQLAEQRRLLCLLEVALGKTAQKKLTLPANFAREVTARAQSDMNGMRRWSERRRALMLCGWLTVLALLLLGMGAFQEALALVGTVAHTLMGVLWMIGHTFVDGSAGVAVILRALGGRFIVAPSLLELLTWVFFAGAVVLLLRLISRYHRARLPD